MDSTSNQPNKEDKLELAKKKLLKFQKKKKRRGSAKTQESSLEDLASIANSSTSTTESMPVTVPSTVAEIVSAVNGVSTTAAGPFYTPVKGGGALRAVEPDSPSISTVTASVGSGVVKDSTLAAPAPSSADYTLNSSVTPSTDTVQQTSSATLGVGAEPVRHLSAPARPDEDNRLSKSMLEHVEYIERLNRVLTNENKSLSTTVKELKEQLLLAHNEKAASERHYQATDAKIAALLKRIEELEAELAAKNSSDDAVASLNTQLLELSSAKSELHAERESLQSTIDDLQKKVGELQETAARLPEAQKSIRDLQDQLQAARNDPGVQQQLKDYQKVVDSLRAQNRDIQDEMDAINEKNKATTMLVPQLEGENKALKLKLADLEAQTTQDRDLQDSKFQNLQDEMNKMIVENQKLKTANEGEARDVGDLRSALEAVTRERDQLLAEKLALESDNAEIRANSQSDASEKRNLEKTVKDLTETLEQMRTAEAGSLDESRKLRAQYQDAVEAQKAIGAELEHARARCEILEKEVEDAKEEHDQLGAKMRESVDRLDSESQKLDHVLTEKNEELASALEQNMKLTDQLKASTDGQNEAVSLLKDLQTMLDSANERIQVMSDQIADKDAAIQRLSDTSSATRQDSLGITEERDRLTRELKEMEADLEKALSENENVIQAMEEGDRQKSELSEILEQLRVEVDSFKSRNAELDRELKERDNEIAVLKRSMEDKSHEAESIKLEVRRLRASLEDADSSFKDISGDRDVLKAQIRQLEEDKATLSARLTELSAALDSALKEADAGNAKISELSMEVEMLRVEKDSFKRELENQIEQEENAIKSQVGVLQEALRARNDEIADWKKKLDHANNEVAEIQAQLDRKTKAVGEIESELAERSNELARALAVEEEKQSAIQELSRQLDEEKAVKMNLLDEKKKIAADMESLELLLNQVKGEVAQTEKEKAELSTELRQERELRQQMSSNLHAQQSGFEMAQEELKRLRESVGDGSKMSESLMSELKLVRDQLEETVREKGIIAGKLDEMSGQSESKALENENLIRKLDESESVRVSLQQSVRELDQLSQKSSNEIKTLQGRIDELERELSASIDGRTALETEIDALKSGVESRKSDLARMNGLLVERDSQIKELSASVSSSEKMVTDISATLSQLEKDNSFLRMECDSLRQSYEESHGDASRYKDENVQLSSQIANYESRIRAIELQKEAYEKEMKSHVGVVETENQRLLRTVEEKDSEIEKLMAEVADTSGLQVLQQAFDEVKAKLEQTVGQLNALKDENSKLQAVADGVVVKRNEEELEEKRRLQIQLTEYKDRVEEFLRQSERVKDLQVVESYYQELSAVLDAVDGSRNAREITDFYSTGNHIAEKVVAAVLSAQEISGRAVEAGIREERAKLGEEFKKMEATIATLKTEKESVLASVDMLENMLADEKESNVRLKDEVAELSSVKVASADQSDADALQKLKTSNHELQSLLEQATVDLERAMASLQLSKQEQRQIEVDFDSLKQESSVAIGMLKNLVAESGLTTFRDSLFDLITTVSEAFAAQKMQVQKSAVTNTSDASMKSSLEQDAAQIEQLQSHLQSANVRIAELSAKLSETSDFYQKQIQQKNEQIATFSQEAERLRIVQREQQIERISETTMASQEAVIVHDLESTLSLKTEEIRVLSRQISEFEQSLAHAEKTIGTLTAELDERHTTIESLRRELEKGSDSRKSNEKIPSGSESPGLERQVEAVLARTGETVNVMDELVRLASGQRDKSDNSREPKDVNIDASALKKILLDIKDQINSLSGTRDESTLSRIEQLILNSASARIEEQKTTEMNFSTDYHVQIQSEDKKEIDQLRSALASITEVKKLESESANSVTIGLLQSHVRQLRKVWEHETRANQILRKLLEELRFRYSEHGNVYQSKIKELEMELQVSKANSAVDSAAEAKLKRVELLESENSRLREDLEKLESTWRSERQTLLNRISEHQDSLSASFGNSSPKNAEALKKEHYSQMDEVRNKFRQEKQRLLDRFKEKISEFDNANRTQQTVIARLKEEKTILESRISVMSSGTSTDKPFPADYLALQREIVALKNEQRLLNENLLNERAQFKDQMDLQKRILDRDDILTSSISNLAHQHDFPSTQSLTSAVGGMVDVQKLRKEREKHKEHCRRLVSEIFVLRIRCKREAGYRADLIYQKNYLLMLMGGLEACERMALQLVTRMGITASGRFDKKRTFKKVATAVVFMVRVQRINHHWKSYADKLKLCA